MNYNTPTIMSISLKNYLLEQLNRHEENHDYQVASETVRCWIDLYEELPQLKDSQASDLPSREAELNKYIKLKHTAEECVGFCDGFDTLQPILASRDARIKELEELLKSDSVYAALRYCFKSPSYSGLDDCKDKHYIDLYNLVCELRKTPTPPKP